MQQGKFKKILAISLLKNNFEPPYSQNVTSSFTYFGDMQFADELFNLSLL